MVVVVILGLMIACALGGATVTLLAKASTRRDHKPRAERLLEPRPKLSRENPGLVAFCPPPHPSGSVRNNVIRMPVAGPGARQKR